MLMYALMHDDTYDVYQIIEYDNERPEDSSLNGKGRSWANLGSYESIAAAQKGGPIKTKQVTVMRKNKSDPAVKENYLIVEGEIVYYFIDICGTEWYPKKNFYKREKAELYIQSAVDWCKTHI